MAYFASQWIQLVEEHLADFVMRSHWTERWQELKNIIKDFFKALSELYDEEVLEVEKLSDDKSHSLELLLGAIVTPLVK